MNSNISVKTGIKLFVNSHKYSQFLGQYCILLYLFVNTLFNGHLRVTRFTKFGYENDKLFIEMFKNWVKFINYLSNL